MFELLKKMKRKEWLTAGLCAILVLGQIYFGSAPAGLYERPDSTYQDPWQRNE